MAEEYCGHLIKGDPKRPCVFKKGHKDTSHRDAATHERHKAANRETARKFREKHPDVIKERKLQDYLDNWKIRRAAQAWYYEENREAVLAQMKAYRESNPDLTKKRKRKYYDENREAVLERAREYHEANPEVRRRMHAKRRAKKRSVPHVPWARPQLIEMYGNYCYLCGDDLPEDWHADHVIPISKGGWDVPSNLRPSCPPCNYSKKDRITGDPVAVVSAFLSMSLRLLLPVQRQHSRVHHNRIQESEGRQEDRSERHRRQPQLPVLFLLLGCPDPLADLTSA